MKTSLLTCMILVSIAGTSCKPEGTYLVRTENEPVAIKVTPSAETPVETPVETPAETPAEPPTETTAGTLQSPTPVTAAPVEDGTRSMLQLDPSNPIEIAGWWDNGRYLLEVRFDFGYRILNGPYPGSPVIEQGRWTRKQHYKFMLEPYNAGKADSETVILSKDRGRPVATIEGLQPFRKLDKAPVNIQDQLPGTWKNDTMSLVIDPDGAFVLTRRAEQKVIEGTWRLELGALILEPLDTSEQPMVFSLGKQERGRLSSIDDGDTPPMVRHIPRTPDEDAGSPS
jgi:hypothetical protein